MTKKDYLLIVEALQETRRIVKPGGCTIIDICAEELAAVLARDNGDFDRDRFLTAAGVDGHAS